MVVVFAAANVVVPVESKLVTVSVSSAVVVNLVPIVVGEVTTVVSVMVVVTLVVEAATVADCVTVTSAGRGIGVMHLQALVRYDPGASPM